MDAIEKEVDRVLTLLRNKIREQGFTQLEVQSTLGWGRSYISQLLTKQKGLRVEQVLRILQVINVDAFEFYAELYNLNRELPTPAAPVATLDPAVDAAVAEFREQLQDHRQLLQGVTRLLLTKQVITVTDLNDVLKAANAAAGPTP